VGSFSPQNHTHVGVIEKATNASKHDLVEVLCQSVLFRWIRSRPGKLDALLADAAVEITTSTLWRVVSMRGLDEEVVLGLELDDGIAQHTASIGLLPVLPPGPMSRNSHVDDNRCLISE
jgi:hypothetical protein